MKRLTSFVRRLLSTQKRMKDIPEEGEWVPLSPSVGTRGADTSFSSIYVYRRQQALIDSVLERVWNNESDDIFDTL